VQSIPVDIGVLGGHWTHLFCWGSKYSCKAKLHVLQVLDDEFQKLGAKHATHEPPVKYGVAVEQIQL
jgi:hypothetical protein